MNTKKKILITGGAGYIGSACVKELIEANYTNIIVFDNLDKGKKELINPKIKFIQGDLKNLNEIEKVFSEHQIDCVIHFAALKAVGESEKEPTKYFQNNVIGSINLLSAMDKYNVKQIIFSSTACVYKTNKEGTYSETDQLQSPNVYGTTKIIIEDIIRDYHRTKNLQYTIFRYFNVAGDVGLNYIDPDAQNIFPIICEVITQKREKLEIFGNNYNTRDGTCVRDYIHLKDLIKAHILAVELNESNEINLGTEKGTTVLELVKKFIKLHKEFNFKISDKRKGDAATSLAKTNLAKNKLNWKVQLEIEDMIKDTLNVYLKK